MSNVKRKDSKNRNLRNGESQRKDGRYVYKYTDIYGKLQFIYSWKLVPLSLIHISEPTRH